jgi:uncharacterized protein (TIGR03435 family)
MIMNRIYFGVAGLFLLAVAQGQTGEPGFAAASIRPNKTAKFGRLDFKPGGRLAAVGVNLYQLVNAAYGNTGGGRIGRGPNCPDWIDSERFDVEAVPDEGSIPPDLDTALLRERMQPMLQRLLAERFNLVVRRVRKELPVYRLTLSKSGAKLTEASIGESECRTSL